MKKLFTITFLLVLAASLTLAQSAEKKVDKKAKQGNVKINQTSATNAVTYDFTTGADKYYGTNGAVELEAGVWGMIAGDANSDGTVNATDYNDHWLPQNGTAYDYSKYGDFNLDGSINAVDYNDFWLINNGKATQVPN